MTSGVTALFTIGLVILITQVWKVVELSGPGAYVAEVLIFAGIIAPSVTAFRKSTSLFHFAIVLVPLWLVDMWLEHHVRMQGQRAVWMYPPGTFIWKIDPVPLRFFITLGFDALLVGPVCLWLARLVALVIRRKGPAPVPEHAYPAAWREAPAQKPKRDAGFYILWILGACYGGYLVALLVGGLGPAPWPRQARDLFEMTYANGLLAADTAGKIWLMAALAFLGAYNKDVRFAATLALAVGHAVSVGASLVFYALGSVHRDFLLMSAIVDGVMIVGFIIIMVMRRKALGGITPDAVPANFSLPAAVWRGVLYACALVAVASLAAIITLRALDHPLAVPDPTVGNTMTLHVTLALVLVLMARSQTARDVLTNVVLSSLGLAIALGVILLAFGDVTGTRAALVIRVLLFGGLAVALAFARRLYVNVEVGLTSFGPPSAAAIEAMHDTLFPDEDPADVVQAVDRYAGTIHGRKRGLLNFPFWLVEMVFPRFYGLRPAFSSMSRDERRWFLQRKLIRDARARKRAFFPEIAEVAFQLGVAAQSMVLFASYGGNARRARIGYVPPGARDRLQCDGATAPPPSLSPAPVPKDHQDPANWRVDPPVPRKIPAPRVTTAVGLTALPDEVDFLVIGSGPGGAVAAYRLAAAVPTARIGIVERGARLNPAEDFNERELEMIAKLYKEGGLQQTKRADMFILQGECVGGTSVINNAVCFRMPARVRAQWSSLGWDLSQLDQAYDDIKAELGIAPVATDGVNTVMRAAFERGVQAVPGLTAPQVVEVTGGAGAIGDGLWNLGNKYNGKRSMLETFIPWAEARGAVVAPQTSAVAFERSGRKATKVVLRSVAGRLRSVKVKRAVVVAGGVISSSHFLMRSGVGGDVGHGMSCNFALPCAFDLGQQVHGFDGEQITMAAADAQDRAVFETYFNPPGAFALTVPFHFDRHRDVMERYQSLGVFGALVGSEPNGLISRQVDLINGHPFEWRMGATDAAHVAFALETLVRLARGAGARTAILPTRPGIELPLDDPSVDAFVRMLRSRPLGMTDLLVNTAHPQGGNARVVDTDFRVHGMDNVFVTDASMFPTSVTVNPQWTIMAMASLAAKRVVALT